MREILFRGKHLFDGKWLYGGYAESTTGRICIAGFSKRGRVDGREVDPETVCQFTGLTDKNGVKIFEGDIVNIKEHISYINGWYKVVYDTTNHYWALERDPEEYSHCYLTFSALNGFAEDSEVIGNIFDNPELVEREND